MASMQVRRSMISGFEPSHNVLCSMYEPSLDLKSTWYSRRGNMVSVVEGSQEMTTTSLPLIAMEGAMGVEGHPAEITSRVSENAPKPQEFMAEIFIL